MLNKISCVCPICDMFDKNPQWRYIRLSNNNQPVDFTDQEAITIYLFVGRYWGYSQVSEIHHFSVHLLSYWFPNLVGIYLHEQMKPIKVLKHGRKAKSMFKYGLTYIASILLNAKNQTDIDVFIFLSYT